MAHNDLAATSSLLRTNGPPTWPTQHGKLVGRKYGGASDRAADLAQVRPIPQQSYGRPDTGKADTFTCRCIPHLKGDRRGGSVRRQGKPQGQPGCQVRMSYNTHYISSCTSTVQGDRKTNHCTNLTVGGVTSGTYPTRPSCRSQRPTRAGALPPDPSSTIPATDFPSRALNHHSSGRAITPYREDCGRANAHGLEPAVFAQPTRGRTHLLGKHQILP
ncbi:hypothetical protein BHE74_00021864 [Ensete ventricosum]|nr:hypothetical protein GW17_00010207 [Ensete ventricosum]RWW70450.1 hypothetical protein BHE74_00021864 [Ensete ventricosum]RZR92256.1 hypothetical protein BHM03_00020497 [Ensete ventricosum]